MKRNIAVLLISAVCFSQERFDYKVRNDYFAGFTGDKEAMGRALAKTTEVLASEPDHAEAMVWHGSGLFYQSGQAFQTGDQKKGIELFMKSQGMMDRAVELEPKNVGVRVPRGAVLLQATFGWPEAQAKPLIEKGLSDYLASYEIQKNDLASLGTHPKGELLFGIADAYRRLGNPEKAVEWFDLVAKSMPGTNYAKRAEIYLTTKTLSPGQARCVGCHTAGR
jgi:tetratricopeptide (TPR) repeat protein